MAGFVDCLYYLKGFCQKGDLCKFRHEPVTIGSSELCEQWRSGLCRNKKCHMVHLTAEQFSTLYQMDYVSVESSADQKLFASKSYNRDELINIRRIVSADEVVNMKKEPIVVDLEIHEESPDHRIIRQAPVGQLERTISIPKDNLDLYYSVDDTIHIKNLKEIQRERDAQEQADEESKRFYGSIVDAFDNPMDTSASMPKPTKVPVRKLVSSSRIEARLDTSDENSKPQIQLPILSSSPQQQQHTNGHSERPSVHERLGERMPPLVPVNHQSPHGVNFTTVQSPSHDSHINDAISRHLNEQSLSLDTSSAEALPAQNRVFVIESDDSDIIVADPKKVVHKQLVRGNMSQQQRLSNGNPSHRANQNINGFGGNGQPIPQPKQTKKSGQTRKLLKSNTQSKSSNASQSYQNPQVSGKRNNRCANSQLIQNLGPATTRENGTYVKVQRQIQVRSQSQDARQSQSATSYNRGEIRRPTTQSMAQKRALRAGQNNSDMAPPTKILSGPPSPTNTGRQQRAREFWSSAATEQQQRSQPNEQILQQNNISMSRLNRLSDNLTGLQQPSLTRAYSSPGRPVVYDVLNLSQEELNVLSQSVKSEPTSPDQDEPNTPPESLSGDEEPEIIWDDELTDGIAGEHSPVYHQSGADNSNLEAPLDLHPDEEYFSDTDLLFDQADQLMR